MEKIDKWAKWDYTQCRCANNGDRCDYCHEYHLCKACEGSGWQDKDIEYGNGLMAAMVLCGNCGGAGEE